MLKWEKQNLGNDVLEYLVINDYTLQAELIELIPIFGNYVFGNYELTVNVFKNGENLKTFELKGLNGKRQGALKQLELLKQNAINYIQ